ncbi:MAG: RdgB/HAM1 family non-canonical purine NTP pyrophosphatase [Methylococcaceae bacterium]
MNQLEKQPIVLASSNAGKIKEIQAMLPDYNIVTQSSFNIIEAQETAATFIENALIKARNAAMQSQLPAIADDSGLIVNALNGAPGVISARYAGLNASDAENNAKLLSKMSGIAQEQRTAYFICVMVFVRHANDQCPLITQGLWKGRILTRTQGNNGFGYDSLFWLPELNCSSAELQPEVKNMLSHRGQALRQLTALIKEYY